MEFHSVWRVVTLDMCVSSV